MNTPNESSTRPFFSVVIPTRNRAHLLQRALQSAFAQDFDDYEVVVSDNDCSDRTPEVVKEWTHPRLRYVRTSESLSMPDHWEFALSHARGQYVGFLCDDDALARQALARAAAVIRQHDLKLLVTGWAKYFGDTSGDIPLRNSLLAPHRQPGLVWKDSHEMLRKMANCRIMVDLPLMLNSFCHRDVLERMRQKAGRIFWLSPDYSFAFLVQLTVAKWAYLDQPLRLFGEFQESIGMSAVRNRSEAIQVFQQELNDIHRVEYAPVNRPLIATGLANTFLLCKQLHQDFSEFEINWSEYFVSCWLDIAVLAENGVDMHDDREMFWRALSNQPLELQQAVKAKLRSPAMRVRLWWGWKRSRIPFFMKLGLRLAQWHYYGGKRHGFSDCFEASQFLSALNDRR